MNEVVENKMNLEEIAIKIDAHGKAAIENILTVGKLLCEAREMLPANNEFGQWREKRISWIDTRMSQRWMNVYKNGGSDLLRHKVATTVLYQLTAPDVPGSAREEAKEHDKLTVKASKELVQAHKELEELKAENTALKTDGTPAEQNLDNLIPAIKTLLDSQVIMPAMARHISVMTPDGQMAWLSVQSNNLSLENQLKEQKNEVDQANAKATESMDKALKAIEEKEIIMARLEEASGATESDLIFKHDKELSELRKGYLAMLKEEVAKEKDKAEKGASEFHQERNKDEIKKAYDARDKAQRERQSFNDSYNGIAEDKHKLEYKIQQLEEQLNVNSPKNIDAAHAEVFKDILDSLKNRLMRFEDDRTTQDYPMIKSWEVINNTISILSDFRDRSEGIVCINPIGDI